MPNEEGSQKKKRGGARPGAGRPAKAVPGSTLTRQEIQRKVELLCFEYGEEAIKWLKKAARGGDTVAARYIIDRVLGRPALSNPDPEFTSLATEKLKLEVEVLRAQEARLRVEREEYERRLNENTPLTEEGRFYPAGGPGVSVCGRYHAALDPRLYPDSPLFQIKSDKCVLCGSLRPSRVASPPNAGLENKSATNLGQRENAGPENNEP